ncbi:PREDICTED: putative F-box protein At1g47790 [Fragaria vesca subsp. vesca]|uniref:putative F-box protein At1g47790 n=1 Tax=Fragaria vesca subsp. vesca TaxID=101020 RepID=UPI0002C37394|nr:PREDICTED: putative F-box protein At1g47790 [Fragaria vesca subsp. vesca]
MGIRVSKVVNVISCFTNKEVIVPSFVAENEDLVREILSRSNKEVIVPYSVAENQDLVREILSRLPVKSLVRFKCVSKEWFALLNQEIILRSNLSILYLHSREGRHHHHKFSLLDRKVDKLSRVESPAFVLDQSFENIYIAGSDSGLVCLHLLGDAGLTEQIVVWNPVTKQYKKLPKPHLSLEGDKMFKMFKMFKAAPLVGFGFIQDHGMDIDYKVVRISKCNDGRLATQVFTRSAKSWRVLQTMI